MSDAILRTVAELRTPLAVGGFVASLFFYVARQIVGTVSRTQLTASAGARILQQILRYFFFLSLFALLLGFLGWAFHLWINKQRSATDNRVTELQFHVLPKYGVSEERFQKLAEENAVNKAALARFFQSLGEENVPPEQVPERLAAFSKRYKELDAEINASPAQTPADIRLKSLG